MAEKKDMEEVIDNEESVVDSTESKMEGTSNKKRMMMVGGAVACFVVVICIVAFVLVLATGGGNSTNKAKDIAGDWDKVENDFYVVGHPSDWTSEGDGDDVVITSPDESKDIDFSDPNFDVNSIFGNSVIVSIGITDSSDEDFDIEDGNSAEKAFAALEKVDCDEFDKLVAADSVEKLTYKKGSLNGLDVCTASIDTDGGEESISFLGKLYAFVSDENVFYVSYVTYSKDATENIKTADEIIGTFNLK